MTPPPVLVLQLMNLAVGFDFYLSVSLGNQVWSAQGWSAAGVGMAVTAMCLGYALLATTGGVLADRWGRARTGALGLALIVVAQAVAAVVPEPWVAVGAGVATWLGGALFFPANAGLFSDARGAGGAGLPLHAKIGSYNLGWSSGNLLAFGFAAVIADLSPRIGYAVAAIATAIALLTLLRWIRLPASPPAPQGDRAPHPALPALLLMCRTAVVLACLMGMAFLSLLELALDQSGAARPHLLACLAWAAYAGGYVSCFVLLARWGGWIFRPWRLLGVQLLMLVGAIAFLCLAIIGGAGVASLVVPCGLVMGVGYGAAYVGSIYYSMRAPDGAARAVSVHETCIGVGNSITPLLGALVIELLAHARFAAPWPGGPVATVIDAPLATPLTALAAYCCACAIACLALQALVIPRLRQRLLVPVSGPAAAAEPRR